MFDVQLSLTTTTATNSLSNETLTGDILSQSLAQQTVSAVETLAQHHTQKILHEKETLLNHLATTKNPSGVQTIINAIGNRQVNMIERAKYNIEQRGKAFSYHQSQAFESII